MRRTISFGKRAINSERKINEVEVEIELRERERDGNLVFSVCADVWNAPKTDIIMGGQCLDEVSKYVHTPLFKEIYRLWKLYHLNDMHAGTPEQETEINDWQNKGNNYEYKKACDHLKEVGLYEVEYNGKPYKYGHGWLYEEIPTEDLNIIKHIIETGKLGD